MERLPVQMGTKIKNKIRLYYWQLKGRVTFVSIVEHASNGKRNSDYQCLFLRKGSAEEEYPVAFT